MAPGPGLERGPLRDERRGHLGAHTPGPDLGKLLHCNGEMIRVFGLVLVFLTTALGFVRDVNTVESLELHRHVVEIQEWRLGGPSFRAVCLG